MKNKNSIGYVILIGMIIIILSACTHGVIDEGGSLTNDDLVFLQANGGTVTGGVPVNALGYTEISSEPNLIGGFVESENQSGESIYWVPEFKVASPFVDSDGNFSGHGINLLNTDKGRPEAKPTSAKVDRILTKSNPDVNEVLIYLDILSGNQPVDGNTHIYVNSPDDDIEFYNFSGVANIDGNRDVSYFNNAESTSAIFGAYDLTEFEFESIDINDEENIPTLGDLTKLNEEEATDGLVLLYLKTDNDLNNHFKLDLYSGPKAAENKFSTLDIVIPMWEGELEAKLTGPSTVLLEWSSVSNENNFVGYRVYKDGEKIDELPKDTMSYEASNLSLDQDYDFSVFALYEINGNIVEANQAIHATAKTPEVKIVPKDTNVVVMSGDWIRIEGTDTFIFMPIDLPSDTTLTVKDALSSSKVAGADGIEVAGDVLEFNFDYPNGATPTEPFLLRMHYDDSFNTDTDIYYYNESNKVWEKQNGTKNENDKIIEIHPEHFSTYGVFALSDQDDSSNEGENNEGENNEGENNEGDNNDGENSEDKNNEGENSEDENNEGENNTGENNDDNEKTLPKTASPLYNYLLIGFLFAVIGTVLFIWSKKKDTIKP